MCGLDQGRSNDRFAQEGTPTSFEEAVALDEKRLPISEAAVEDLSALEAPDDVSDDYDEYLAERERFLDLLRQQQQAGEVGDEAAYRGFGPQFDEASDAADEVGEEIGLKACAQVLPEDQIEDVATVMEETGTKVDPAHCTEDYTENFVEAAGGPETCRASEQDPDNQANSIDISEISGVDEVYARTQGEGPGRTRRR